MRRRAAVLLFVMATVAVGLPACSSTSTTDARAFGPLSVERIRLRSTPESEGGWLTVPRNSTGKKYRLVLLMHGFRLSPASVSWLAPRIASRGYAVYVGDVPGATGNPKQFGQAMVDLHRRLAADPEATARVDAHTVALVGHSMSGGGAIWAAAHDKQVAAVVSMAPYVAQGIWDGRQVPTLILGCDADPIARLDRHADLLMKHLDRAPFVQEIDLRRGRHACVLNGQREAPQRAYAAALIVDFLDKYLGKRRKDLKLVCAARVDADIARVRGDCG